MKAGTGPVSIPGFTKTTSIYLLQHSIYSNLNVLGLMSAERYYFKILVRDEDGNISIYQPTENVQDNSTTVSVGKLGLVWLKCSQNENNTIGIYDSTCSGPSTQKWKAIIECPINTFRSSPNFKRLQFYYHVPGYDCPSEDAQPGLAPLFQFRGPGR